MRQGPDALIDLEKRAVKMINWLASLEVAPIVVLLGIMAFTFLVCIVMDATPFLLISVPILDPIVKAMEFDPIWFWVLFLINLTVGSISPPFGFTMFALQAAPPEYLTMRQVFRSAWWGVLIMFVGMGLIIAFPSIATFLPSLL